MGNIEKITNFVLQEIEYKGFSGELTPKTRKWFRQKIKHIIYLIQDGYSLQHIPELTRDKTDSSLSEWLCNVQQSWYFVSRALREYPQIQNANVLFSKANELMVEELCKVLDNKEFLKIVREL